MLTLPGDGIVRTWRTLKNPDSKILISFCWCLDEEAMISLSKQKVSISVKKDKACPTTNSALRYRLLLWWDSEVSNKRVQERTPVVLAESTGWPRVSEEIDEISSKSIRTVILRGGETLTFEGQVASTISFGNRNCTNYHRSLSTNYLIMNII